MDKIQHAIQSLSQVTVGIVGTCALIGSAWNGSPIGQAINPYFSKALPTVQSVKISTPRSKCRIIDGEKYCK